MNWELLEQKLSAEQGDTEKAAPEKKTEIKTGIKIGIEGLGQMAFALLNGIISNKMADPADICGYDISEERCRLFSEHYRLMPDAAQVAKESDVVIIAVKPQNVAELFSSLRDVPLEDKLVISIAAGIPISKIKALAGADIPTVRVLPNNPMLVGCGMSVIAYEPPVTEFQAKYVESLFAACGRIAVMEERLIDPSIAIHSSSPAYLYLFTKAVADYAESVGIDRSTAISMFAKTLQGCAAMIDDMPNSAGSLDELIAAVRSPKGTTAAALDRLNDGGFCELIKEAMDACTKRAEELGRAN